MENPLWHNSKWVSKFIAMAIACLAAVWVVVPFLWAIDNSLKTDLDIFRPGAMIPFLQFTITHTAGSHFCNGIGESSKMLPTFTENCR